MRGRTRLLASCGVIIGLALLPLCSAFHNQALQHNRLAQDPRSGAKICPPGGGVGGTFGGRVLSRVARPEAGGGSGGRGGITPRGEGGGGDGGGEHEGSGWGPLQLWAKYIELLDTSPLKTRIVTGGVISAAGDIMSQTLDGVKLSVLDLKRLIVFSMWGAVGFTPFGFKWYNLIEATVPKDIPLRWLAKMAMDQSIFPAFMTTVTFMSLTILEGLLVGVGFTVDKGLFATGETFKGIGALFSEGVQRVKKTLVPTLVENYKVWPAAQVLNFSVVPLKFQVLFVNCVAVWWNFVLSMTQHH